MTSGISHPISTAKSPSISPPTTDSELFNIFGVLSDANLNASIINSTNSSWTKIGSFPASSGMANSRKCGTSPGYIVMRYHAGVIIKVRKNTIYLTILI